MNVMLCVLGAEHETCHSIRTMLATTEAMDGSVSEKPTGCVTSAPAVHQHCSETASMHVCSSSQQLLHFQSSGLRQ